MIGAVVGCLQMFTVPSTSLLLSKSIRSSPRVGLACHWPHERADSLSSRRLFLAYCFMAHRIGRSVLDTVLHVKGTFHCRYSSSRQQVPRSRRGVKCRYNRLHTMRLFRRLCGALLLWHSERMTSELEHLSLRHCTQAYFR